VRLDVAAEVVACFGEEDVLAVAVEVVREGGAGDTSADDEAVAVEVGGGRE